MVRNILNDKSKKETGTHNLLNPDKKELGVIPLEDQGCVCATKTKTIGHNRV
jgi:hypothetical protein